MSTKKGKELKPHIGIFGKRNAGKSSLINFLVGQQLAIVSTIAGTTTDPVKKSTEITGFGPVVIIDTAGIDDIGELGIMRIQKTIDVIKLVDLAIVVITDNRFDDFEENLVNEFNRYKTPFFIVHNKSDLVSPNAEFIQNISLKYQTKVITASAITQTDNTLLLNTIATFLPEDSYKQPSMLGDLISYGDVVLFITPIDVEAPAGRLILPQIQAIRDTLDNDAVAIVLKEREVDAFLRKTAIKPKLAVTDSQIFLKASASVPKDIPLTSFSILLARLKGEFQHYLNGTPAIENLKNGDKVLLLESCTHHVSCDDIGRVKIPRWMSQFTGKNIDYEVVSGLDSLTKPITEYSLVIQCGGCMITGKQLKNRLLPAIEAGVPVSNYGMTIAYLQGVFKRAVEIFQAKTDHINYL
jgi:[FeFe] hydrogenase H-cluster maturation GTPase HydF